MIYFLFIYVLGINIAVGKLVGSHLKALEIINTIRNKYLHMEEHYRILVINEIEVSVIIIYFFSFFFFFVRGFLSFVRVF